MNKRLSKFISVILMLSLVFSMASCSQIESFFDLDHDNEKKSRDHEERDQHSKGEDVEDTDDEDTDDAVTPTPTTSPLYDNSDLTYPDHIPTLEELHPEHAPGPIAGEQASALLDSLETRYLQLTIGSSYVSTEIYFADPAAYGLDVSDVSWGNISLDNEEYSDFVDSALETLYSINYEALDYQDRAFYDKFLYDLEVNKYMISYSAFSWYSPLLDPVIGPQTEILFLLDVIQFETVEDAENYIVLLEDIDRYFDEMAEFEEERVYRGFASSAEVYEDMAQSFYGLVAQEDDCFLYESFETRIDSIAGITDEQKAELISRNETTMHNVVFPEFQECGDRMASLVPTAEETGAQHGMCDFEGGDAYYSVLFMRYSNSLKSIEETTAQLEAMISSLYTSLISAATSTDDSWMDEYLNHNYSYGDTTANLNYLETAISSDFPSLPEHSYVLRDVPASLEENFSPAAYLGYHLDRFDSNLIITNPGSISSAFGIVCAHEGYPGHMFQSVYTRSVCEHPYLYLNDSIGYSEGWATYVENYCYKYFTDNVTAATIIEIENSFNSLICARIDIGVNYEGWDKDDCNDYYYSVFGTNLTSENMDRMITIVTNQPGYGVKYGIGYLNTGLVLTQIRRDFPELTDQQVFTAYLNALPLTFEMIYERMYSALSSN